SLSLSRSRSSRRNCETHAKDRQCRVLSTIEHGLNLLRNTFRFRVACWSTSKRDERLYLRCSLGVGRNDAAPGCGAGFCGLRSAVAGPADRAIGVKAEFQPGAP